VYEYVIGERRKISRATLSHSTLEVDGAEQSEIWAAHRIGGRPRVELVDFQLDSRIEATCAGWSTPDLLHRRIFMLQRGGLEIRDRMEGSAASVRLSLPLAPGVLARTVHDQDGGAEAHLELPSGRRMRVQLPAAAEWRLETCVYFPRFGVEVERSRLFGEARSFESGTWRFELLN
ncbi:MAG: heparinase II/III family protein, partial [Myxococcota bacterium]